MENFIEASAYNTSKKSYESYYFMVHYNATLNKKIATRFVGVERVDVTNADEYALVYSGGKIVVYCDGIKTEFNDLAKDDDVCVSVQSGYFYLNSYKWANMRVFLADGTEITDNIPDSSSVISANDNYVLSQAYSEGKSILYLQDRAT